MMVLLIILPDIYCGIWKKSCTNLTPASGGAYRNIVKRCGHVGWFYFCQIWYIFKDTRHVSFSESSTTCCPGIRAQDNWPLYPVSGYKDRVRLCV